MKTIDWNKDSRNNCRVSISDGVMTCFVSEDQLPYEFSLREIAQEYARGYDHNGSDDYVVARIEDVTDGQTVRFAFHNSGRLEWPTTRTYLVS